MRVAVVNWGSRRVGGIEEYIALLLPALKGAGLDVAFWHESDAPKDRVAIDSPAGTADFCAAEMGRGAALQALRDWKPDSLYVQGTQDVGIENQLLDIAPAAFFLHTYVGTCISGGKTFTRPIVVPCSRVFGPACLAHYFPHGCGGNNPLTMVRLYQEQSARLRALRRYRAILTHTEHMRKEAAAHGLDARVVPYPVPTMAAADPPLGDGMWRLLFAGRMDAIKGGLMMIDAMPLVFNASGRPLRVIMAGDGRERALWESRARAIEQAHDQIRFEFTGWLHQDQVGARMKSADLLVVPSLWPEPFGSVGPAAGQHGLPAAAFAVGGIPQWLHDGVSGHLAPGDPPAAAGLAQAIVACLEDPLHYTALRAGARTSACTFTMERHLPELLATFEELSR